MKDETFLKKVTKYMFLSNLHAKSKTISMSLLYIYFALEKIENFKPLFIYILNEFLCLYFGFKLEDVI